MKSEQNLYHDPKELENIFAKYGKSSVIHRENYIIASLIK